MRTVLITGASSGIGFELSKIFARNNYNLVIVARRKDKLEFLRKYILSHINDKVKIYVISLDLSKNGVAERLYKIIKDKKIFIDILVNNAGIGIYGEFIKYSSEDIIKNDEMISLNINTLVNLTNFFLKDMIANSRGKILNVASIAAFSPGPLMATYYATKSFVLSFSEAIMEEIKNTNIKISVLCPGPVCTEFEKSYKLVKGDIFNKLKIMSAETVAKIAYKEFSKNKRNKSRSSNSKSKFSKFLWSFIFQNYNTKRF